MPSTATPGLPDQGLHDLLDQIDQLKRAYELELSSDDFNENTLIAIKNRLTALDRAAAHRMGVLA